MNNNDRRVLRTKKAIQNAFKELIQERPLESITISDIARRADINRRTFYLHYSIVKDIVTEIEEEDANRIREAFSNSASLSIGNFLEFLTDMMMDDFAYYSCIVKTPAYSFIEHNRTNLFKECITSAFYKSSRLPEDEFNVYSEYVASGIMGVYTEWIRSDSNISLDRLTTLAAEAVSSGWEKITS